MYALPETDYLGVKLMFQDEAGFGRINKPKLCWSPKGFRPNVPCQQIREYQYSFGAVEPATGDSLFLALPASNSKCMNIFLDELSRKLPDDMILLICDRAAWHTTPKLTIPKNIKLFYLPPATPEMNPIEQIWDEIREKGFRNEIFKTLDEVIDRLQQTVQSLLPSTIQSITQRG